MNRGRPHDLLPTERRIERHLTGSCDLADFTLRVAIRRVLESRFGHRVEGHVRIRVIGETGVGDSING
jgi:hypothetical protein